MKSTVTLVKDITYPLYFPHTLHLPQDLLLQKSKNKQPTIAKKPFSASLLIIPGLLPQISLPHLPPFLSPLSSLPFPLVRVNFCFWVQPECSKSSSSKNFLIFTLKINSFFPALQLHFSSHLVPALMLLSLNYASHFNYSSHSSVSLQNLSSLREGTISLVLFYTQLNRKCR